MSMLGCTLQTVRLYHHTVHCLLIPEKFKNVNMRKKQQNAIVVKEGKLAVSGGTGKILRWVWDMWKHSNLGQGRSKMGEMKMCTRA